MCVAAAKPRANFSHATAMTSIDTVAGEVLDEIFTYLDDSAIYTCLLVNRRFRAHATPFLYRDIVLQNICTIVLGTQARN